MPGGRVNIYKIAKEAGVSPATVSRVMTNNARVSEEKRKRVEEVIARYDYTPNALAQGLSTARTHTIGIMVADIVSPFYSTLVAECEKEADRRNHMLLILTSLSDIELEKRQLLKLYEQHVDAIMIIGGRIDHVSADEEYTELINRIHQTIPIVSTGKLPGAANYQVCLDESGSMDLAMDYLYRLGHNRIAVIGGRKDAKSTWEKQMRYRVKLEEFGIPYNEALVIESGDYSNEGGYRAMKRLLQQGKLPTAIIAINDHTASGIIRAAQEANLRIPDDISLISFDNTYLASAVTPKLTAIGCDYAAFGSCLVDTAIRAVEGENIPERQIIAVETAQRESCKSLIY